MSNKVSRYNGYNRTARGPWYRAALSGGEVVWSGDSGVTETGLDLICDDDPAAFAASVPAPAWTAGMTLAEGAFVTYQGDVWRVVIAHTTQTDWAPGVAPNLFTKVAAPAPGGGTSAWDYPVAYSVGDLVTYQGTTYKCLQAHTSQSTWMPSATPALWQPQ